MVWLLISLIVLIWFCCILCMLMLFKLVNLECCFHRLFQEIEELKAKIKNNLSVIDNTEQIESKKYY